MRSKDDLKLVKFKYLRGLNRSGPNQRIKAEYSTKVIWHIRAVDIKNVYAISSILISKSFHVSNAASRPSQSHRTFFTTEIYSFKLYRNSSMYKEVTARTRQFKHRPSILNFNPPCPQQFPVWSKSREWWKIRYINLFEK